MISEQRKCDVGSEIERTLAAVDLRMELDKVALEPDDFANNNGVNGTECDGDSNLIEHGIGTLRNGYRQFELSNADAEIKLNGRGPKRAQDDDGPDGLYFAVEKTPSPIEANSIKGADSDSGHSTTFNSTPPRNWKTVDAIASSEPMLSAQTDQNRILRNEGERSFVGAISGGRAIESNCDPKSNSVIERNAHYNEASSSENASTTSKKASILDPLLANDTSKSILEFEMNPETISARLPRGRRQSAQEDGGECEAIWRQRYFLSKRDDVSSSSLSGDLSDGEAFSLSEGEEQVFESNPSSQESEPEQCGVNKKRNKKWKHSSLVSKANGDQAGEEESGAEDDDDDEDGIGDDASSLASSTSCSENSFEIGTVLESAPATMPRRTINGYAHFLNSLPLPPSKSGGMDAKAARDCIEEERETSSAQCSFPGGNEEIELKLVENNNDSQQLAQLETAEDEEGNNIFEPTPSRVTTSPRNRTSSSERANSTLAELSPIRLSSLGLFSSTTASATSANSQQRRSINDELLALDTALPNLDFDKLEKQLADAAMEREMNQRKLMGQHVLRRLTTDAIDQPHFHPPAPTRRPLKSNLGTRLQSGMSLQICFMNDVLPTDDEDEDSECAEEDGGAVPKSRSTPNLGAPSSSSRIVGRSVSSCGDSAKRASELRRAMLERHKSEDQDFAMRQARLEEEAKVMLVKAKEAARMQMEMERQEKSKQSIIEKVIGMPTLGRRKLTRQQLTKMCITQLQIILNDIHSKIEALNEELVHLLIERDSLHMEQDSMLVDIEDLLQHHRSVDVTLPDFLGADPVITSSCANSCNNNNTKQIRFRIFKR